MQLKENFFIKHIIILTTVLNKNVLEVTGKNVANFCDDLIKDSKTYSDIYQESIGLIVNKSMEKLISKKKK